MEEYPKELKSRLPPLIFAIDAILFPSKKEIQQHKETLPNLIQRDYDGFDLCLSAEKTCEIFDRFLETINLFLPSELDKSEKKKIITESFDFFAYSRIVPVSRRHAFPPSSDPNGTSNSLASLVATLTSTRRGSTNTGDFFLSQPLSSSQVISGFSSFNSNPKYPSMISEALRKNPIQGMLPSGWMEKHAHALPSVLLLVTRVDSQIDVYEQAKLERHLSRTCELLRSSLASKRNCRLHLVCLVNKSSPIADINENKNSVYSTKNKLDNLVTINGRKKTRDPVEQERISKICTLCQLSLEQVTVIPIFDLFNTEHKEIYEKEIEERINMVERKAKKPFNMDNFSLNRLQSNIQNASMGYYMNQAKRCIKKYSMFIHERHPELLPIEAKYCIKIAVFYEFQSCIDVITRGSPSTKNITNIDSLNKDSMIEISNNYWKEAYKNVAQYYQFLRGYHLGEQFLSINRYKSGNCYNCSNFKNKSHNNISKSCILSLLPDNSQFEGEGKQNSQQAQLLRSDDRENVSQLQYKFINNRNFVSASKEKVSRYSSEEVALTHCSSGSNPDVVTINDKSPGERRSIEFGEIKEVCSPLTITHTHANDMAYQCRGVADWLNFKILLEAYIVIASSPSGHCSDGIEFIATHSLTHIEIFLDGPWIDGLTSINDSIDHIREGKKMKALDEPLWYYLLYSCKQYRTLAELAERFSLPLETTAIRGRDIYVNASPAMLCAASAEIFLKLYTAIQEERDRILVNGCGQLTIHNFSGTDSLSQKRQRFVGAIASSELVSIFQEAIIYDYSTLALSYLNHALKLRQDELNVLSDENIPIESEITCSRIFYLIGGVLMKIGKYNDASLSLENSLKASLKWPTIQLLIHRALMSCWYKCLNLSVQNNNIFRIVANHSVSIILDPQINIYMTQNDFNNALNLAFSFNHSKVNSVIERVYSLDKSSPFVFSLSFSRSSAIAGDIVNATLCLESNLRAPIEIVNIKVVTSIGSFRIPIDDILTTLRNSDATIFPNQRVHIPVHITLSKKLSNITSFNPSDKNAGNVIKPRTSDLTYLGGGLYMPCQRNSSLKGGLYLRCLALEMSLLSPKNGSNTIFVKINNNIDRSMSISETLDFAKFDYELYPIEEGNYFPSAWTYPGQFPLALGPRYLRILPPRAQLEIKNITALQTKGIAMEGTINRILIKLTSGSMEACKDLNFKVTCKSLISPLGGESDDLFESNSLAIEEDMIKKIPRPPVLVEICQDNDAAGNTLPKGWRIKQESEYKKATSDYIPIAPNLEAGEYIYIYLDLFRPLSDSPINCLSLKSDQSKSDQIVCRTQFIVSISYNQSRPCRADDNSLGDNVTQVYKDSVIWILPMKAYSSLLTTFYKEFPCGSRSPLNLLSPNPVFVSESDTVVNGKMLPIRFTLKAKEVLSCLEVKVNSIIFKPSDYYILKVTEEKSGVTIENRTDLKDDNLIFIPKSNDLGRILKYGSKLNVVFTVRPNIPDTNNNRNLPFSMQIRLGIIAVNWTSMYLKYPKNIIPIFNDRYIQYHGPLPVENISPLLFYGPTINVECTPFEASFRCIPEIPRIASIFNMCYTIRNKTHMNQLLKITLNEETDDNSSLSTLITGFTGGKIHLGPEETKEVIYSVFSMQSGMIDLPSINISSLRYKSWVVRGGLRGPTFVMP